MSRRFINPFLCRRGCVCFILLVGGVFFEVYPFLLITGLLCIPSDGSFWSLVQFFPVFLGPVNIFAEINSGEAMSSPSMNIFDVFPRVEVFLPLTRLRSAACLSLQAASVIGRALPKFVLSPLVMLGASPPSKYPADLSFKAMVKRIRSI